MVARRLVVRGVDPCGAPGSVLRLTERGQRPLRYVAGPFRDLLGRARNEVSGTGQDGRVPVLRRQSGRPGSARRRIRRALDRPLWTPPRGGAQRDRRPGRAPLSGSTGYGMFDPRHAKAFGGLPSW
jgi:hypothetical protein